MRLRAIEIKNWACIDSLVLTDLADGIIVLHGPNQTGKSSVVEALRCCLFDLDHNSAQQRLSAAIPRRTKAVPEVAVELELRGTRFRVAKAFSRNKEGFAELKEQRGANWHVLEKGKNANQKIRELLGVEKSTSGLFQLLWLKQGEVQLPDKPDQALAKSLEEVLGSMITGRDLDFKTRLDKACERWFTPTMQDKKASPVLDLTAKRETALTRQTETQDEWNAAEANLMAYDAALAQQPLLQRDLEIVEDERAELAQKREAISQRRAQHDVAVKHRDAEMRHLEQAQQQLRDWDDTEAKRGLTAQALNEATSNHQCAEDRARAAQQSAERAQAHFDQAERALTEHRRTRADLDDRRQLVNLSVQCTSLDQNINRISQWLKSIGELEAKLAGPPPLSAEEIEDLRANRNEATKLTAQLEAGELLISIRAQRPFEATPRVDGDLGPAVALPTDGETQWHVRQQAEITLGDFAVLKIGRAQENRDLDLLAARLAELDRVYQNALTSAQVDAALPNGIDLLVRRRLEHEQHAKELRPLRDAVVKAAPDGLPALQAQRDQLRAQQSDIFARRAELSNWSPDSSEISELQNRFDTREVYLKTQLDQAKNACLQADEGVQAEQKNLNSLRDKVTTLAVELRGLGESLAKQDHAGLTQAAEKAKHRLDDAQARVAESTLSDAELTIEDAYQAASSACKQRTTRKRANDDRLLELKTNLAGTEGLHQKRVQADQAVADLDREWKRETLYAEAHRHLKELFEQVRNEQVRRTVGPINDRVIQWAKQLGLADCSALEFGDQLLPGGLAIDGDVVEMLRESYGTQEQLSILIRLAIGGLLARQDPAIAILDDPLAHSDVAKHRRMLDILARATAGEPHGPHPTGPLQLIVLTCHADRFDYLHDAQHIDLSRAIRRGG